MEVGGSQRNGIIPNVIKHGAFNCDCPADGAMVIISENVSYKRLARIAYSITVPIVFIDTCVLRSGNDKADPVVCQAIKGVESDAMQKIQFSSPLPPETEEGW